MPKRVLDFDALWASDKLAACAAWAQAEYAWLYGLADAHGCFELTNLRVIWGRVAAIRRSLSIERLEQIFDEFADKGLLFRWEENGKRYGHWTGSDVPGRLPPPSWRNRLERFAPAVPAGQLAMYLERFARGRATGTAGAPGAQTHAEGGRPTVSFRGRYRAEESEPHESAPSATESSAAHAAAQDAEIPRFARNDNRAPRAALNPGAAFLNPSLEATQAQDGERDQEREENQHTHGREGGGPELINASVCVESALAGRGKSESAEPFAAEGNPSSGGQHEKSETQPRVAANARGEPSAKHAQGGPQVLVEIWQRHRGPLPAVKAVTPERLARCRARLRKYGGRPQDFLTAFREAVRRAAATPFLRGEGPHGWRASFDWMVANDTNYLKVLEGRYEAGAGGDSGARPGGSRGDPIASREAMRAAALVGTGPHEGVAVRGCALERLRRRDAG